SHPMGEGRGEGPFRFCVAYPTLSRVMNDDHPFRFIVPAGFVIVSYGLYSLSPDNKSGFNNAPYAFARELALGGPKIFGYRMGVVESGRLVGQRRLFLTFLRAMVGD